MSDDKRMNISDEAIHVAHAAFTETLVDLRLREGGGFKVASQQRRAIEAALEAAAPHLMGGAWSEGYALGEFNGVYQDQYKIPVNPYRSAGAGE